MATPLSVEQIVKRATVTDFDPQYKLQQWFRTAKVMLKQASIYEHEGNDQEAYLLLYRFSLLALNDLPKHPDAKDPQFRSAWAETRKELQRSLAKLEILKPRLNKRYEAYLERQRAREESRSRQVVSTPGLRSDSLPHGMQDLTLDSLLPRDERDEYGMDPVKHSDMAVSFANEEIKRRIRSTAQEDSGGLDGSLRRDLSSKMTAVRRRLDGSKPSAPSHVQQRRYQENTSTFDYPSVPHTSDAIPLDRRAPQSTSQAMPPRPPKLPAGPSAQDPRTPALPPKLLSDAAAPIIPPKVPSESTAETNTRIIAPQFAHLSHLENGTPLRTIFLPTGLRQAFLRLADANTAANLETMGLLCGTLIRNALFISKLVIPAQTSTSDTCEMLDEESLLAYIEEQPEGLWTLGWIHTHPSQTCFLSSRDLHTHMGYQRTLVEAIAIVCAPRKNPDWGVFRLTDPPGMQAIAACHRPGLFHPHDEDRLYTDVLGRPGHVIEHAELEFDVVDLRSKST